MTDKNRVLVALNIVDYFNFADLYFVTVWTGDVK